ncbi:MAG TPA: hypothetical protein VMG32_07290 [Anaeromyxobacteraceae bacterium]|nr:hypothetical protein [Anaeromyxobacteraceae bacterium]
MRPGGDPSTRPGRARRRPAARQLALGVALAALGGCAPLRSSETVCPEYRDLRCLTRVECSMDRGRGCEVCRCERLPASGDLPSGVPPDRRPE